jgi:hypothetical protein
MLDQIQKQWMKKFYELNEVYRGQIAGPFVSARPVGYDPVKIPSILYVGKATRGAWFRKELDKSLSVGEWRMRTLRWIDSVKIPEGDKEYNSAFWRFARQLSIVAAEKAKHKIEPLSNLVCTNLYKIGALDGNPNRELRKAQQGLAIETLRWEIRTYEPKLIVFATGNYGEDLMDSLVGTAPRLWNVSQASKGYWWRRAKDELPALMHTGHPQGKPKEHLHEWLTRAKKLLLASR